MPDDDSYPDPEDVGVHWIPRWSDITDSTVRQMAAVVVSASFAGITLGLYAGGMLPLWLFGLCMFVAGVLFAGFLVDDS